MPFIKTSGVAQFCLCDEKAEQGIKNFSLLLGGKLEIENSRLNFSKIKLGDYTKEPDDCEYCRFSLVPGERFEIPKSSQTFQSYHKCIKENMKIWIKMNFNEVLFGGSEVPLKWMGKGLRPET